MVLNSRNLYGVKDFVGTRQPTGEYTFQSYNEITDQAMAFGKALIHTNWSLKSKNSIILN